MKKRSFFTFRTDQEDNKFIEELARLLVRNKSDAVRYTIKKVVFQSRNAKQLLNEKPNNEPAS